MAVTGCKMAEKCILHHEGERIFAKPIERAVLRDARLSFAARGLFCFLWDLPTGWEANSRHLAKMSPQGRGAILTMLGDLQALGAMRIAPIHANGKLAGRAWIVRAPHLWAQEAPISNSTTSEKNEDRKSRRSKNSTVEKVKQKVHQLEGSPNLRFTEPPPDSTATRAGEIILASIAKRRKSKNATA